MFEGARDFVPVAFILSLASGFGILLGETGIQTVLVASIAAVKNAVPTILLPTILFGLFFLISIFIPSQSGFGRTVCPVAAPALMRTPSARQTMTAYMLNGSGMTISGSILTFSMANGLVCLTIPTSGVFAIATEMCDVPLGRFYKKA
ncbi:MAG: hypothetical protein K2M43_01940 [Mycoplasmoidaceae bacterium]|nr:hypothetical protein [Mycoplasmoidaceae bacterium]